MKQILSITLLLFIAGTICGQSGKRKIESRLKIGILYSPSITYRKLPYSEEQSFISVMRNENETPKYGYTAGMVAQRSFGKKSDVELGVSFSNMGFKTEEISLTWKPPSNSFPTHAKATFSYLYLGVSARYRYVLFGNKIQYYIMPGISIDALIERKATVSVKYANGRTDRSTSYLRGGFSEPEATAIVSIGAKHMFSKRYSICLEPIYRRELASTTPDKAGKEFLYSVGLNVIMLYSLYEKLK
jgi:hypothetical protein